MKERLLEFLENRAFEPVLKASPDAYSESDRRVLEQAKRRADFQRHRFRAYRGAAYIRREFEDDLNSQAGRKAHAALKRLHLPALSDFRDEFLQLADSLGVKHVARATVARQPDSPHLWPGWAPEARRAAWRRPKHMGKDQRPRKTA